MKEPTHTVDFRKSYLDDERYDILAWPVRELIKILANSDGMTLNKLRDVSIEVKKIEGWEPHTERIRICAILDKEED